MRRADAERIDRLRDAYGAIRDGYRQLERLSRRQLRLLRAGAGPDRIVAVLREKRSVLRAIRAEEGSARQAPPPTGSRELLSILDAVSRRAERAVALEVECRALLQTALRRASGSAARRPDAHPGVGAPDPAAGRELRNLTTSAWPDACH